MASLKYEELKTCLAKGGNSVETLKLCLEAFSKKDEAINKAVSHMSFWCPQLFSLAFSDCASTRILAVKCINLFMPKFVDRSKPFSDDWWKQLKQDITKKYAVILAEKLNVFEDWDTLWKLCVSILDIELYQSTTLVNALLKVAEKAFRDKKLVITAYHCWKHFITVYAKSPNVMFSSKQISLLITPLTAKSHYTVKFCEIKLEVWNTLILLVVDKSKQAVDVIITPLLNFLYGPLKMPVASSFPELVDNCAESYLMVLNNPNVFKYIQSSLSSYLPKVILSLAKSQNVNEDLMLRVWKTFFAKVQQIQTLTLLDNVTETLDNFSEELNDKNVLTFLKLIEVFMNEHPTSVFKHLHRWILCHRFLSSKPPEENGTLEAIMKHYGKDISQLQHLIDHLFDVPINFNKDDSLIRNRCLSNLSELWIMTCDTIHLNIEQNENEASCGLLSSQTLLQLLLFPIEYLYDKWSTRIMKHWRFLCNNSIPILSSAGNIADFGSTLIENLILTIEKHPKSLTSVVYASLEICGILLSSALLKGNVKQANPLIMSIVKFIEQIESVPSRQNVLLNEALPKISLWSNLHIELNSDLLSVIETISAMSTLSSDPTSAKLNNKIAKVSRVIRSNVQTGFKQTVKEAPSTPKSAITNTSFMHRLDRASKNKQQSSSDNLLKLLSPSDKNKKDEDGFVIIPPKTKVTPLTKHQKEVMKSKKVIAAMYNGLSQDTQSQDSQALDVILSVGGQRPIKKTLDYTNENAIDELLNELETTDNLVTMKELCGTELKQEPVSSPPNEVETSKAQSELECSIKSNQEVPGSDKVENTEMETECEMENVKNCSDRETKRKICLELVSFLKNECIRTGDTLGKYFNILISEPHPALYLFHKLKEIVESEDDNPDLQLICDEFSVDNLTGLLDILSKTLNSSSKSSEAKDDKLDGKITSGKSRKSISRKSVGCISSESSEAEKNKLGVEKSNTPGQSLKSTSRKSVGSIYSESSEVEKNKLGSEKSNSPGQSLKSVTNKGLSSITEVGEDLVNADSLNQEHNIEKTDAACIDDNSSKPNKSIQVSKTSTKPIDSSENNAVHAEPSGKITNGEYTSPSSRTGRKINPPRRYSPPSKKLGETQKTPPKVSPKLLRSRKSLTLPVKQSSPLPKKTRRSLNLKGKGSLLGEKTGLNSCSKTNEIVIKKSSEKEDESEKQPDSDEKKSKTAAAIKIKPRTGSSESMIINESETNSAVQVSTDSLKQPLAEEINEIVKLKGVANNDESKSEKQLHNNEKTAKTEAETKIKARKGSSESVTVDESEINSPMQGLTDSLEQPLAGETNEVVKLKDGAKIDGSKSAVEGILDSKSCGASETAVTSVDQKIAGPQNSLNNEGKSFENEDSNGSESELNKSIDFTLSLAKTPVRNGHVSSQENSPLIFDSVNLNESTETFECHNGLVSDSKSEAEENDEKADRKSRSNKAPSTLKKRNSKLFKNVLSNGTSPLKPCNGTNSPQREKTFASLDNWITRSSKQSENVVKPVEFSQCSDIIESSQPDVPLSSYKSNKSLNISSPIMTQFNTSIYCSPKSVVESEPSSGSKPKVARKLILNERELLGIESNDKVRSGGVNNENTCMEAPKKFESDESLKSNTNSNIKFSENAKVLSPRNQYLGRTALMMNMAIGEDSKLSTPSSKSVQKDDSVTPSPPRTPQNLNSVGRKWVKRRYVSDAPPTPSILKKSRNDENEARSKVKLVSFSDPPMIEVLEFSASDPQKDTVYGLDVAGLTESTQDDVGTQGSVPEMPEVSDRKLCFSSLTNCGDPVAEIIPLLVESKWHSALKEKLETKNLRTIGCLASLTELQACQLPIGEPRLFRIKNALKEYHRVLHETRKGIEEQRKYEKSKFMRKFLMPAGIDRSVAKYEEISKEAQKSESSGNSNSDGGSKTPVVDELLSDWDMENVDSSSKKENAQSSLKASGNLVKISKTPEELLKSDKKDTNEVPSLVDNCPLSSTEELISSVNDETAKGVNIQEAPLIQNETIDFKEDYDTKQEVALERSMDNYAEDEKISDFVVTSSLPETHHSQDKKFTAESVSRAFVNDLIELKAMSSSIIDEVKRIKVEPLVIKSVKTSVKNVSVWPDTIDEAIEEMKQRRVGQKKIKKINSADLTIREEDGCSSGESAVKSGADKHILTQSNEKEALTSPVDSDTQQLSSQEIETIVNLQNSLDDERVTAPIIIEADEVINSDKVVSSLPQTADSTLADSREGKIFSIDDCPVIEENLIINSSCHRTKKIPIETKEYNLVMKELESSNILQMNATKVGKLSLRMVESENAGKESAFSDIETCAGETPVGSGIADETSSGFSTNETEISNHDKKPEVPTLAAREVRETPCDKMILHAANDNDSKNKPKISFSKSAVNNVRILRKRKAVNDVEELKKNKLPRPFEAEKLVHSEQTEVAESIDLTKEPEKTGTVTVEPMSQGYKNGKRKSVNLTEVAESIDLTKESEKTGTVTVEPMSQDNKNGKRKSVNLTVDSEDLLVKTPLNEEIPLQTINLLDENGSEFIANESFPIISCPENSVSNKELSPVVDSISRLPDNIPLDSESLKKWLSDKDSSTCLDLLKDAILDRVDLKRKLLNYLLNDESLGAKKLRFEYV